MLVGSTGQQDLSVRHWRSQVFLWRSGCDFESCSYRVDEDYPEPLRKAFDLVGGVEDLSTQKRNVVIKVGLFHHYWPHHSSVDLVKSLVDNFGKAPKVFLAESDNYVGKAVT